MRKRSLLLLVVLVGTWNSTAISASAHLQMDVDANDSRSPLDIRVAGIDHSKRITVGVLSMVGRFRNASLGAKGDAYVDFDTTGSNRPDYYVWVNNRGGRLKARVYKYTRNSSYRVGRGVALRYNSKIIGFGFRSRLIKVRGGYFRWVANTRYVGGTNRYGNIVYRWDFAPNNGMKGHSLSVPRLSIDRAAPSSIQAAVASYLGSAEKADEDDAPVSGPLVVQQL